jgi:predicted DNA-binding antitoxin AbrB/MazE fold protein
MDLSVDATYENGVLKPISPLPLKDRAKVRVTVQEIAVERRPPPDEAVAAVRRTAGLLGKPAILSFCGGLRRTTSSGFWRPDDFCNIPAGICSSRDMRRQADLVYSRIEDSPELDWTIHTILDATTMQALPKL